MTMTDIKVKLHEEIEHGDSKLLKMIYALVQEYNDNEVTDEEYLEQRKAIVREEREKYLRKEGRSYSWEEVKKIITERRLHEI